MVSHRFALNIPADRYQNLYAGSVRDVIAVSDRGVRVRFPGKLLHRFVTHAGINGMFEIRCEQVSAESHKQSDLKVNRVEPQPLQSRMVSIKKIV